jgi:hypothetical protein
MENPHEQPPGARYTSHTELDVRSGAREAAARWWGGCSAQVQVERRDGGEQYVLVDVPPPACIT